MDNLLDCKTKALNCLDSAVSSYKDSNISESMLLSYECGITFSKLMKTLVTLLPIDSALSETLMAIQNVFTIRFAGVKGTPVYLKIGNNMLFIGTDRLLMSKTCQLELLEIVRCMCLSLIEMPDEILKNIMYCD